MTEQPPEMVPSAEERIMRAYHLDAYGAPIWSALFAACATAYRDGYAAGIKAERERVIAAEEERRLINLRG